jgi:hypothetical protein
MSRRSLVVGACIAAAVEAALFGAMLLTHDVHGLIAFTQLPAYMVANALHPSEYSSAAMAVGAVLEGAAFWLILVALAAVRDARAA